MFKNSAQPDNPGMDTTKTERLLRQAMALCQEVTGRTDISDELLCEAFRQLLDESRPCYEAGDEDNPPPDATWH